MGSTNRTPLAERFWPKVNKDGLIHPVLGTACWLWTGAKDKHGYGSIGSGGHRGPTLKAARVSWEIQIGPIPNGIEVCHHCDVPSCVRPDHLFLGTHTDNMQDAATKGRSHGNGLLGESIGNAIFTENQIRSIRSLHASGIGVREIGRKYGTSHTNIGFIIQRRTWRHVP